MITNEELNKLSYDELRQLNKQVVTMINHKRIKNDMEKAMQLLPGETVFIDHKKHIGEEFEIEKLNSTTAKIKSKRTGMPYNVSYGLIKKK